MNLLSQSIDFYDAVFCYTASVPVMLVNQTELPFSFTSLFESLEKSKDMGKDSVATNVLLYIPCCYLPPSHCVTACYNSVSHARS